MLRAETRGVEKPTQLTRAQQMLIEEMPKVRVQLLSGECNDIPRVVFQEAYRWGPNVKGRPPRHHKWYDMLSAGEEGVVEAALHFDPHFGDGNVSFAEYARKYVRAKIFEVLNDRQIRVPLKKMKGGGWRDHPESLESFSDSPEEPSSDSVLINGPISGNEDPYAQGEGSRNDVYIRVAREDYEPLGEQYQLCVAEDAEAVEDARAKAIRGRLKEVGLTPREIEAFELRYNFDGKRLGPNPSFEVIGSHMGIQTRSAWNLIHRGWEKLSKANGKEPLFPTSSLEYWRGGERNRPAFEMAVLSKIDKERGKSSEPFLRVHEA